MLAHNTHYQFGQANPRVAGSQEQEEALEEQDDEEAQSVEESQKVRGDHCSRELFDDFVRRAQNLCIAKKKNPEVQLSWPPLTYKSPPSSGAADNRFDNVKTQRAFLCDGCGA